jgi:glycosyltransferase involved in cell wall biosynthesis
MSRRPLKLLLICHHRRLKTVFRSEPFARKLAQRGYEVTLLCIANTNRFRLRKEIDSGVLFVESPDLLPGRLRSGWDPWDTLRRILYLRSQKYDLIHAFETRPATIYPALSCISRKPTPFIVDWNDWWGRGGLITELRPLWYQRLFGGLETFYEEHFRARADSLTVISDALAQRATELGVPKEHIFKIRGGADIESFLPLTSDTHRQRFNIPKSSPVLAFSAADVNVDTSLVLSTFHKVLLHHPSAILIVTGNKPRDFDQQVSFLGINSSVCHLGFLPYHDLPAALSCADIFMLPFRDTISNRGRWPHKIGDYMSLARATVTNPVGEMKLLFEQESVGLLARANPEDMAEKVSVLINNRQLREELGTNARRVAEAEFSWERTVDALEKVYIDTMARIHPDNKSSIL